MALTGVVHHDNHVTKTGETSFVLQPASQVPAGNLLFVLVALGGDGAGSIAGVSGGDPDWWAVDAASDFTQLSADCWAVVPASAIAAGTNITVSLSASYAEKVAFLIEVQRDAAGSPFKKFDIFPQSILFQSTTTGASASPSISLAASNFQARDLLMGFIATEGPAGDSYTADSDSDNGVAWGAATRQGTTGGGAASNVSLAVQHKIVTEASVTQTFNPSITDRDWLACFILIRVRSEQSVTGGLSFSGRLTRRKFPLLLRGSLGRSYIERVRQLGATAHWPLQDSSEPQNSVALDGEGFPLAKSSAFIAYDDGDGPVFVESVEGRSSWKEETGGTNYLRILNNFAVNDRFSGGPSGRESFTVIAWVKRTGSATDRYIFTRKEEGASQRGWALQTNTTNTVTFSAGVNPSPGAATSPGALPVDTWTMLVGVRKGTDYAEASRGVELYLNGALSDDGISTASDVDIRNSRNVTLFNEHALGSNNVWQGNIAHVSFFERALTATEIQELYDIAKAATPPSGTGRLRGVVSAIIQGGGTTFTQGVSGALSFVGGLLRRTDKTLTGAASSSGTLVKESRKTFAGETSPAGALVTVRLALLALAGVLSPSGALLRQVGKLLSGQVSFSGFLGNLVAKFLGGTVAASGTLTKEPRKLLVGTLSFAGTLVKTMFGLFTGSLGSSGVLTKQPSKTFTGSSAPQGDLTKQPSKTFTGSLASVGGLVKTAAKNLAGTLASSGSVIAELASAAFTQALAGTLSFTGTLIRQPHKLLSGAVSFVGTFVLRVEKLFSGVVAPAGTVGKAVLKTLAGAINPVGVAMAVATRVMGLVGTLSLAGAMTKATWKDLVGSIGSAGALSKRVDKVLGGVLSPGGALSRAATYARSLGGLIAPAGSLIRTLVPFSAPKLLVFVWDQVKGLVTHFHRRSGQVLTSERAARVTATDRLAMQVLPADDAAEQQEGTW